MAVVVSPRPVPHTASRLAEFGLVLVGPPYKVHSVVKGSPADDAGVLPGDRLLMIDGHKPESLAPEKLIESLKVRTDQPVILKLQRGARTVTVRIVASKEKLTPKSLQLGITFSRRSSVLIFTQYEARPAVMDSATEGQWVKVNGRRAILIHKERGACLRWYRAGLLLDIEAPEGGFTDDEMMALAKSTQ